MMISVSGSMINEDMEGLKKKNDVETAQNFRKFFDSREHKGKFARTLFAKAFFCRILYLDGGRKGRQTLFSAGKNSVDNEVCGGGAECGMSC